MAAVFASGICIKSPGELEGLLGTECVPKRREAAGGALGEDSEWGTTIGESTDEQDRAG